MKEFNIVILFITLAFTTARNVVFNTCEHSSTETSDSKHCSIHNIRVEPCATLSAHSICDIRRFEHIFITMEYTPYFEGMMYGNLYLVNGTWEVPMFMAPPVCGQMSGFSVCRDVYAVSVNTSIEWRVAENIPNVVNTMIMRIWDDHRRVCCAIFSLMSLP